MKLRVRKSKLNGTISVPGSKSHTIRAVAVATLADGVSVIRAPLLSADADSSLDAAQALGATIEKTDALWRIAGVSGQLSQKSSTINVGNSGTSLRIFTALAATAGFAVTFDGDHSIRSRPMAPLLDALGKLGVQCHSTEGRCPFTIQGPIQGGETEVDGTSSQFLTALLFATPLAQNDTLIKVHNLHEKPYVEITLDWLKKQEIQLSHNNDFSEFHVKGNQAYQAFDQVIPADFSTATFPLLAAAVTGGNIQIRNLDFSDRQGDKAVFDHFQKMGVAIDKQSQVTHVSNPTGELRAIEVDLNNTPDALPAMAVAAALAEGKTILSNVAQARIKETDRIKCMTCELRKMGVNVEELPDGMVIEGTNQLQGTELEGYDDHRIVMALAIAGMVADGETVINGAEAASVTYPGFVPDFVALGANMVECNG